MTRDADPEVIDKAYRALSLKHHPDRAGADHLGATERMQQINEAYRVLRNPESRQEYDRSLRSESDASAWDQFMAKGLLGLFLDRVRSER